MSRTGLAWPQRRGLRKKDDDRLSHELRAAAGLPLN